MSRASKLSVISVLVLAGCASGGGAAKIHPPRPVEGRPAPIADPPPSRVTMHVSIFSDGLKAQLDAAVPSSGEGDVDLIAGRKLHYAWTREPFGLKLDRGRVILTTKVNGSVKLLGDRAFTILVKVAGEPVITPDYQAVLQSTEVDVSAEGSVESVNKTISERLEVQLAETLEAFRLDVRPLVEQLHARLTTPIPIEAGGGTKGCAELRVAAIEAGPTVLAGGIEKDLGVVVLPSVTLPCARTSTQTPALPLLANVASIPSGPFEVVVPVAADYVELSRAMDAAIGGKLYFSKEYPKLYLHQPEVFASDETLVIKLSVGGFVEVAGATTSLEGELYFSGHPRLQDNQITVPDLELTPGTLDALLGLKVAMDGGSIRDQARQAMRLDISERLQAVKDKLSTELSFSEGLGCARAELLRAEVTGIHPHASFLRIYLAVHAQGSLYVPCKR
ncbi:DUF4403 family protein [Myxococcota bacterium]|nr:DUF4403 family protein [Myxococcota bacterium]